MDIDQHNKCFSTQQRSQLEDIAKSCQNLFEEIKDLVSRYCDINKSHGIRRTWKRLKWEPDDARDLRTRLTSNISTLNAFNGRITREDVSTLLKHKSNQKDRMCLDWLSPTTHATRQNECIHLREPGTGKWLLESDEFKTWSEDTGDKTMFCPGIPGAGKTILSSVVIDELETRYCNDPQIGVAYIYCSFQNLADGSQKPERFLSAILRQLLCGVSPMPVDVQELYDKHEVKGTRPTTVEILPALSSVVSSFRRWLLVIDALDECSLTDATRFLDTKEASFISIQFFNSDHKVETLNNS
jgi:DNA replication protein DnaC